MEKFKKNDILIRKWKKENGGEIDVCIFTKCDKEDDGLFLESLFIRVKNKKIVLIERGKEYSRSKLPFYDIRMKINWRKATKKEILKINSLLANLLNTGE